MQRVLMRLLALLVPLTLSNGASAVESLVTKTHDPTAQEIDVLPGQACNLDVSILPTMWDASGYIRTSLPGLVEFTGATFNPPWNWSSHFNVVSGLMDAQFPYGTEPATVASTIATLSLRVEASLPAGDYTINAADFHGRVAPNSYALWTGTPGPDFHIRVVPEPSAGLLLLAASVCGAWRRAGQPPLRGLRKAGPGSGQG